MHSPGRQAACTVKVTLRGSHGDVVYLCLSEGILCGGILNEPGHASPAQADSGME